MKNLFFIASLIALAVIVAALSMGNYAMARIAVFVFSLLLIPHAAKLKWSV